MAQLKTHIPEYYIKRNVGNGILDKFSTKYTRSCNIQYTQCLQISLHHGDNEMV